MGDLTAHLHPGHLKHWQENHMEHIRYAYPLMPHDKVLDIGAYAGEFATDIHKQYGCDVVAVEPTDAIEQLRGKAWCTIVKKAAGTKEGTERFGGAFYYSSALETSDEWGFKDFPTFDVLDLLHEPIGLCKINIEGMEAKVMPHILKSGLQKNVKYFQIQFHLVDHKSEDEYQVIAKELQKTHKIHWRCPFVWESWVRK